MTVTTTRSALAGLQGTAWMLVRYTCDGVTASLSSDMRTVLTFDTEGGFAVTAGLLSGSGRAVPGSQGVALTDVVLLGTDATRPGSLEDRVVRACDGTFEVSRSATALVLRRPGTTLEFVGSSHDPA